METYTRNCPYCDNILHYSSKKSLQVSSRKNGGCRECYYKRPKPKGRTPWLGKTHTTETIEKIRKSATGRPGPNKGKIFSEETKKKMRVAAIERISRSIGQFGPRYNSTACIIFNAINSHFNWNGVHAENGGEYYVNTLGYWVDYYEPTLNLVIEYDEKRHTYSIYKDRDVIRQNEIVKYLGCKFIRISEADTLEIVYNKLSEVL